jgi:hypothetical protein
VTGIGAPNLGSTKFDWRSRALRGSLRRSFKESSLVPHRFSFAVASVTVAFVGFSFVWSGCSAQGEGDRCTFFPNEQANNAINGTDECQDGLICYPGSTAQFDPTFGTYDRCCPMNLPQSTVQACLPAPLIDAGRDAEMGDGAFVDAEPDTAKADAPSDAELDSAHEDAKSDAKHEDAKSEDAKSDGKSEDAKPEDAKSDKHPG